MAFLDEKIVEKRQALKQQSHRNIYNQEVYAGNAVYHFVPTRLFEGNVQVMLPDTFIDMPELLASVKYPSQQRPQVIKTGATGTVNFCFNLFIAPIQVDQIENAALTFRSILQRTQPSLIQMEQKNINLEKNCISWFDFRSFSLDEQIYNLLFVTSIGGKLMNGTMNCPAPLMRAWKPIMQQVVLSIEDHTKDEKLEG